MQSLPSQNRHVLATCVGMGDDEAPASTHSGDDEACGRPSVCCGGDTLPGSVCGRGWWRRRFLRWRRSRC